jgi:hypothetical protein
MFARVLSIDTSEHSSHVTPHIPISSASSRQQAAGSRQQAAGSRQQAAGSRQQAASSKQQAASRGSTDQEGVGSWQCSQTQSSLRLKASPKHSDAQNTGPQSAGIG